MSTVAYGATEYISTEAELIAFAARTDYSKSNTYTLTKDITVTDADEWFGIGHNADFTGTFYGAGYVVTLPENSSIGLFDTVDTAKIKNVTVEGSIVTNSADPVGGLVKTWAGSTLFYQEDTINNCVNAMNITNTGGGVGGLVGTVNGIFNVTECANIGERMTATDAVGGLICHWNKSNGYLNLSDNYVVTTVKMTDSSTTNVHGFVGYTTSTGLYNSSTNEETSYCCMFLDSGNGYTLVTDLSPSGDDDGYCKVVSDPSIDREDYDGYNDEDWLHVANMFPRLVENNPYNTAQIMGAIVPVVDEEEKVITMRNVYGGAWSYDGKTLEDGDEIDVDGDLTLTLNGYTRNYPVLEWDEYEVKFINASEGNIMSVAPYGGDLHYEYEIENVYGQSKFDDAKFDEIELTSSVGSLDNFTASIDDSVVSLDMQEIGTYTSVGDVITGTIYFHDATTLAMGTVDFSLTIEGEGLGVQFFTLDAYDCTGETVPVEYDVLSVGFDGDVSITYYTEYEAEDDTKNILTNATADGATTDGGAPSYAGTYYYVAVFDDASAFAETTKTGSYTIEKVTLTETLKYSSSSDYDADDFVYDGTTKTVKYTDLTDGLADILEYGDYYVLDDDGEYELTTSDNSGSSDTGKAPSFAGSYKRVADVTSDTHYITGTQAVTFTIFQETVNVVVEDTFFEYDGSGHTPDFDVSYSGAEYEVTYYEDAELEEEVTGTPTTVGTYWYVFELKDTQNLKLSMIQNEDGEVLSAEDCYFIIAEVETISVTISDTEITWSGVAVEPTITLLTDSDATQDDFEFVYYDIDDTGFDAPLSDVPTDAGEYRYYVESSQIYEVTFYDADEGVIVGGVGTFTISPKKLIVTVIDTAYTYEWNGLGILPGYSVVDEDNVAYSLPDSCVFCGSYYENNVAVDDVPSDIGEYTFVFVLLDEDGNLTFEYKTNEGVLSITDRKDWTESLVFEPNVEYQLPECETDEGWKDQYDVIYRSLVPFFVSETKKVYLTKVEF